MENIPTPKTSLKWLWGLFFFLAVVVLWKGLPWEKGDPLPRKKPTLHEELESLISSLQNCPPQAESLICERLQNLTGLSFGYGEAREKEKKKEAISQWTKWWKENKKDSPPIWWSRAASQRNYPYRGNALLQIGRQKPYGEGIQTLLEILKEEDSPLDLQKESLRILGRWRVKEGILLYRKILAENILLAGEALWALGMAGEEKDFSRALPFLKSQNPSLRERGAEALYNLSPARSRPHLIPLLSDSSLPVRMYAFTALKDMVSNTEMKELIQTHVSDPEMKKSMENLLKQSLKK